VKRGVVQAQFPREFPVTSLGFGAQSDGGEPRARNHELEDVFVARVVK
jgi:hypothetical protein